MVAWEKEIIITFSNEMKLITESESEPQYPVLFLFLLPYSHGWSSVAAILVLSAYQSASAQCPLFDYIGIFFLLLYEKIRCVCPLWVVWGIIAVAAADPVLLYVRTEEVEEEILAQ